MISLPPLANLLAIREEDPEALARVERALRSSGEFGEVFRPANGWTVGVCPLPYSEPDPACARDLGLVFAEGRDAIAGGTNGRADDCYRKLAERSDSAPHELSTFPGDFGFLRFRPNGEAIIVRSCGGLVPFYWWHGPGRVAIATRLGWIPRYVSPGVRIDPLVNAVWTTGFGFFPDNRTFLKDVWILPRGNFARVARNGEIRIGTYWDPRPKTWPKPTPERVKEHAERLRAILVGKLERDLHPDGGNLLTLSGGVDSSSLAALAVGTLGKKISTWSFLPARQDLLERELSYIDLLAREFRFERMWKVLVGPETRLELLRSAPKVVFHVIHPALGALPGLTKEASIRVLFGGEFADEVCGSSLTFPDWIAATSLFQLITGLGKLPNGSRDVLRWGKRRAWRYLHLPDPDFPYPSELSASIRRDLREDYREWWQQRHTEALRDRSPWSHLLRRMELDGFVTMNWEATSAVGVRRSFPFFNREAIGLVLDCHPSELVGPGSKKLLRSALRGDSPQRNLGRPDKGRWGDDSLAQHTPCEINLDEMPYELYEVIEPVPIGDMRYLDSATQVLVTELAIFSGNLRAYATSVNNNKKGSQHLLSPARAAR